MPKIKRKVAKLPRKDDVSCNCHPEPGKVWKPNQKHPYERLDMFGLFYTLRSDYVITHAKSKNVYLNVAALAHEHPGRLILLNVSGGMKVMRNMITFLSQLSIGGDRWCMKIENAVLHCITGRKWQSSALFNDSGLSGIVKCHSIQLECVCSKSPIGRVYKSLIAKLIHTTALVDYTMKFLFA